MRTLKEQVSLFTTKLGRQLAQNNSGNKGLSVYGEVTKH